VEGIPRCIVNFLSKLLPLFGGDYERTYDQRHQYPPGTVAVDLLQSVLQNTAGSCIPPQLTPAPVRAWGQVYRAEPDRLRGPARCFGGPGGESPSTFRRFVQNGLVFDTGASDPLSSFQLYRTTGRGRPVPGEGFCGGFGRFRAPHVLMKAGSTKDLRSARNWPTCFANAAPSATPRPAPWSGWPTSRASICAARSSFLLGLGAELSPL
jgi:hypothetical protein